MNSFQQATGGLARVGELLGTRTRVPSSGTADLPSGALAVDVDDVSFAYEREPVLRSVSCRVAPGQVLGLLGRTGSGKTTISRLLFRLHDPSAGAVRLGGVDLRHACLDGVRARVGLVTQDVQLFAGTLRDNVTLFDPEVTDERLCQVFAELGLDEWLRSLHDGLDTPLGPGGRGLSAGEAQLVALARVFLKEPGLVILDEASSRLDPATERLLERAVARLLEGRTGVVIAHRLATVERADTILILEDGQVAEMGPRAELAGAPRSRFAALLRVGMAEVLA
jgi:ABC-type multidrug transport system fused ATPase/permease subunit